MCSSDLGQLRYPEVILPQKIVLPQNEVFGSVLQDGVFEVVLSEINKPVFLPQNEM